MIRSWGIWGLAIGLAILATGGSGRAGLSCLTAHGEAAVTDCSAVLDDTTTPLTVRVAAWRERAAAHFELVRYAQALADLDEIIAAKADQPADWWRHGRALAGLERYQEALSDYEKANRLLPNDSEILESLANLRQQLQQFGEAALDFGVLVARFPEVPVYRGERGWAYYNTGLYDLALDDYGEAIAMAPKTASFWNERALTYEQIGDFDKALSDYGNALSLAPDDPVMLTNRGRLLRGNGRTAEALKDFDAALAIDKTPNAYFERALLFLATDELPKAETDVAEALKLGGSVASAEYIRGRLAAEHDDYDAAIGHYDKSIALNDDGNAAIYWRAVAHMSLGNDQQALAGLTASMSIWPDDTSIRIDRNDELIELGRYDEAIGDFDQMLAQDEKSIDALIGRSRAHSFAEHWPQAIADAEQALVLDPKSRRALYRRAYARKGSGDFDGALADYTALTLTEAKSATILSERAEVYRRLSRFDEGLKDFAAAIALEPKRPDLQWNMGFTLESQGRYAEALSAYQRAVDVDPDYAWGYEGRAWALMGLRRLTEAMADCEKIIAKLPREPAAYRCRAQVRQESEDAGGAKLDLLKALELDPKYAIARYDLGRLYLDDSDYENALEAFTATIRVGYLKARSLLLRGDAHRGLRDDRLAINDYRSAAALDPADLGDAAIRRITAIEAHLPKIDRGEFDYPSGHASRGH